MAVASISRRFHHTRSYPQPPPAPLPTITPEPEKSLPGLSIGSPRCSRGWHIGLSPLRESAFNRSKSAIKAMDYAALGLAVLASDMPVYRGSVADGPAGQLVANDPQSWYAALAWLVRNRDLRVSLAAGARQAFLASCSLAVQAEARRAAWMALLGKRRIETAA
jgi:glycosyltransferase involved in cell wall biosynthesis